MGLGAMDVVAGCAGAYVGLLIWTFVIAKVTAVIAGGGASLVVKELAIRSPENSSTDSRIRIVGRREGLLAFLLTLVGLSPTTTLTVNAGESVCKTSGLLGVSHQSIPMDRVAQVTSGSKVAFEYIVYAIIVALIGIVASLASLFHFELLALVGVVVVTSLFIGVALLLYHLNKRFYVGVYPQGGWPMLLVFKPNVMEGVELNLERALEIAATIRALAVDARRPTIAPANLPAWTPAAGAPLRDDSARPSAETDEPAPQALLRDAQQYIKAGDRESAVATLQYLIRRFPGSREAEQAARSLARAGVTT